MFSCEICEIFGYTYFEEHLWTTVSTNWSISAFISSRTSWKSLANDWFPSQTAMFFESDPRCFEEFFKFQDNIEIVIKMARISRHFSVFCDYCPTLFFQEISPFRRSRSQMFLKIGALKMFPIFTGEHLYWSPFLNKVAGVTLEDFSCDVYYKEMPELQFNFSKNVALQLQLATNSKKEFYVEISWEFSEIWEQPFFKTPYPLP